MKENAKNILHNKYIIFAIAAAVIIAVLAGFTAYGCILVSGDKAVDGVTVLNTDMSGKSKQEIEDFLAKELTFDNNCEIQFVCGESKFSLAPSQINLQPDIQQTAEYIYNIGKNGNIVTRIIDGYHAKFAGKQVTPI